MKNITLFVITTSLLSFSLSATVNEATIHSEKIVLGSGCFWGAEKGYEALPGVIDAVSGYADGNGIRPTYREITKLKNKFNVNNHAEVVEVTYNKNIISTEKLLMHFFESHDPTQINRQGNDVGRHYRSIILFGSKDEETYINNFIDDKQKSFENKIVTQVKKLDKFFVAEKYHQNYFELNSSQPYCRFVILPKLKKVKSNFPNFY